MSKVVRILYFNWRGNTNIRTIIPDSILFSSTQWHKENQWLLKAYDMDKKEERLFAVKDILKWGEKF
jgi:hypothetical protein